MYVHSNYSTALRLLDLYYTTFSNKKMAAEALKEYGDLGLIIETERYYDPPEI